MRYSVEIDEKLIENVQSELGDFHKKAPSVITGALNRAVTNVNSNIKKQVRKEYIVKAEDIQKTISKTKASRGDIGAEVKSRGNLMALDKFKVSPKTINPRRKSPIKVAVKKGAAAPLPGAFMSDINGPKLFKRSGKKRLPIKRLFGPSVPQMIGNEEVRTQIEKEGQETFQKRLDQNIKRILEKGRS